jgi:hypothetical protein
MYLNKFTKRPHLSLSLSLYLSNTDCIITIGRADPNSETKDNGLTQVESNMTQSRSLCLVFHTKIGSIAFDHAPL